MKHIKIITLLIPFLLISCQESSITTVEKTISFPEFFVEQGSDSDNSYISLKGFRNNNRFEIQATGWGIWEYGLFLQRANCAGTINFSLMGECGTVTSRTWTKVTFVNSITPEETDTLWVISFTDYRDTITVGKTVTH